VEAFGHLHPLATGWWSRFDGENTSGGFPLNGRSPALEAARRVKAGAGTLFGLTVLSTNVGAQFLQVFDARDAPVNGAAPSVVFDLPAGLARHVDFGIYGRSFVAGLWLANSSTSATLTAGAADCWFDAQYV
jgi:hypothetical protein